MLTGSDTVRDPVPAANADDDTAYAFDILGLSVRLTVDDRRFTIIARAFMDAYGVRPSRLPARGAPDLVFEVAWSRQPAPALALEVGIHRTKHAYWTLDGRTDRARALHVWPSRGIVLERHDDRSWSVSVDAGVDPVFASESIFHAIRSVALYRRPAGNLLHGSAVAIGKHVVGFIGPSMAGKTTLMTTLLDTPDCAPFANDRFLVLPGDDVPVMSWPSYASFCEGQLLANPVLAAAARAYERNDCAYRTRIWGPGLAPVFDKAGKRTYPMAWLRDAYRRDYVAEGRLAAIVCCRVSADIDALRLTALDTGEEQPRQAALDFLRESSFDTVEPSFLPWHGMAWPDDAPRHPNLLDRLRAAGGIVLKLEVPVSAIDHVAGALRGALPNVWEH